MLGRPVPLYIFSNVGESAASAVSAMSFTRRSGCPFFNTLLADGVDLDAGLLFDSARVKAPRPSSNSSDRWYRPVGI